MTKLGRADRMFQINFDGDEIGTMRDLGVDDYKDKVESKVSIKLNQK